MGASSSLLDETKANYIKGRAEAELKNFSPHYRQQALQARVQLLQEEAEPRREGRGQLLTPKETRGSEELLYHNSVNCHDDSRKWKERFVVVRGNHTLELHDTLESFSRGTPARHSQSLTGGEAMTSEDTYSALLDKAFPDPNGVKEETQSVVPAGWFPVFLYLPYSPDIFFCFRQEEQQAHFLSILNTCIRHQNLGWREGHRGEVLALQRALLFYRQEKNHYECWELQLGSDLQVLSNLVMEELLPSLQTDLLPRLRGRRRLWTAVVQAAYQLVQEQLAPELEALKEECRQTASANQTLIRSDLDQILASRAFLQDKLSECVCVQAERVCSTSVAPCLPSLMEEVRGGVRGGLLALRRHLEEGMTSACLALGEGAQGGLEQVTMVVSPLSSASLEHCYQPVEQLREKLQDLRQRFRYSDCQRLIHTTQIDMQQLMESAVHTFELLVQSEPPAQWSSTVEKIKLRVLKLYDHDSRLVLKRILKEALTDITLPVLRRNLAPTCKPELQKFEQFIFADYSQLIQVENEYEDLLLCLITKEINKVMQAAASEKNNHLQVDSSNQATSQTSLSFYPDPGLDPDPNPDPSPNPSLDPKPDPNLGSKPLLDPGPDPIPDPSPIPDPNLDLSPDPNPIPDPSPIPDPNPDPSPNSDPSPNPDPSLGLSPDPSPNPDPSFDLSPDPSPNPDLDASFDPSPDPVSISSCPQPTSDLQPASLKSEEMSDPSPSPASPPAPLPEFSPQDQIPAAPSAVGETRTGCEVIATGCDVIPTGCNVIDIVTDSLASLSATAPPTGQRQATDRAVYLNPPKAHPETRHSDMIQDAIPISDSGVVYDTTPMSDSGTVPSDTPMSDSGTVPSDTPISDSGTVPSDTPMSDSGTVPSDTPMSDSGTVPSDTPMSDSGTVPSDTPMSDSGTLPSDTPMSDNGTVQDTTPTSESGTVKSETPMSDSDAVQETTPMSESGTFHSEFPMSNSGTVQSGETGAEGEEPSSPLDSIKQIRELVVEVIEVEDLVYRRPQGNDTE